MRRRDFLRSAGIGTFAFHMFCQNVSKRAASITPDKPNIIFILLDEWGYFEMSGLGHDKLLTPNIDKFAGEGIRFTQALAGAPVCGPSRACLMTGRHMGHVSLRVNHGYQPIRADDYTIARMLKEAGYATGGFGKWGCGGRGTTGVPENHGFDEFFGYYDQRHAHTYFPRYLIHNSREVNLPGNTGDYYRGQTFSHNVIYDRAFDFIKKNKGRRFFCYLPFTLPHGLWGFDINDPAWALFKDKLWTAGQMTPNDAKVYAAMMAMVDRQIGELIDLLKQLELDEKTIIFLCGDNGGQDYFFRDLENENVSYERGFFAPNVDPKTGLQFRGEKRSLYEGGLRIPMLIRWPQNISPGQVSGHLWYFPDVLPTLAELASAPIPKTTDGISIVPTLLKSGRQEQHAYLYWEYNGQTAVRMGHWKAVQPDKNQGWELYDLTTDVSEKNDLAGEHPHILEKMAAFAEQAHEPAQPGQILDLKLCEKDNKEGSG